MYFFSKDIDSILNDFVGESFSKYLADTADHAEFFARGFSDEGDLSVEVYSDGDNLYDGTIFLNEAEQDATPD